MVSRSSQPPSTDSELRPWTEETLSIELWGDLEPGLPAPEGSVERDEGYWSTVDRERLFWQAWYDASSERRGTVALMHGYGEHSARYEHVALALVRAGYNVMAIDARGHGKSTGRRGYVKRYARYVDDLAMLKRRARDRWPKPPLFILGHSNGGLIALRYALRKPADVTGFVISSPLCGLAMKVPAPKRIAGKLTSRIAPGLNLPSGLSADMVSQLPRVIERYAADPLIFETANARWFTEADLAMHDLLERAPELEQPFLFLVAGSDRIVDAQATTEVFHRLGSQDRELEIFPDLYHEVLNEAPWATILQRAIIWMDHHR